MANQIEEIYTYIKENPGATVEQINRATGWNRHVVEVACRLMVGEKLIVEVGVTEWGDPEYEMSRH